MVAIFVSPTPIGKNEFSLVELARAAIESLPGRAPLVVVDPTSEFVPPALRSCGERGLADLWRGQATWRDIIQATTNTKIDLASWGPPHGKSGTRRLDWNEIRSAYQIVLVAGSQSITPQIERLAADCDATVLVLGLGLTGQEDAAYRHQTFGGGWSGASGCVVTGVAK